MKRWYSFYNERITNRHQVGDELAEQNRQQLGAELLQQVAAELQMPEIFGRVPWGQYIDIISKRYSKTSWGRHLSNRASR